MYEKDKLKNPPDRSFRAFLVFNYRISYQVKTDLNEIRIVRIRHTGREPIGLEVVQISFATHLPIPPIHENLTI